MSDKFPTLTLMGINNTSHIQSYSLSQVGRSEDVLRIRYKRPKGSWLATTRSYEFKRTPTASEPSGMTGDTTDYEVADILKDAIKELDLLLKADCSKAELLEDILSQMTDLENDLAGQMANLRSRITSLKELG